MGSKSDYLENKILDYILGNTSYSPPSTIYFALYTSSPSDTEDGTEAAGDGYSRVSKDNNTTTWRTADSGIKTNAVVINFPIVGVGGWGTIVSFGILDASTGGNLLFWGDLTDPKVTEHGDLFRFQADSVVIQED